MATQNNAVVEKNVTAEQAKRNMERLSCPPEGAPDLSRSLHAGDNEDTIYQAATKLDQLLERIIRDAEEARRNLRNAELHGLNSCGLFQGMIHDADTAVTKLHLATESRKLYSDLLKQERV